MERIITTKRLVVMAILIILGFAGFWLLGHSYIEVEVGGAANGELTYTIAKQGDRDKREIKTSDKRLKILVSSGDYEVLVKQNQKSSLAVVAAGGLLGVTKTAADLESEKTRTFVGNNPGPCMYLISDVLASSPCQGLVEELGFHLPATAAQASFVKKAVGPAATLEALIPLSNDALALVSAESESEGEGNVHLLYRVNSGGLFSQSGIRELSGLDSNKLYGLTPYREGYLATSDDGTERLYYASFDSEPERVVVEKPAETDLSYRLSSTAGDAVTTVYSNDTTPLASLAAPGGQRAHSEELEADSPNSIHSVVVVSEGKATRRVKINGSIIRAELCGTDTLCLLTSAGELLIYGASGNGYGLFYKLTGVLDIGPQADSVWVVKPEGVFALNIDKRQAYMLYSFGEFSYCGSAALTDQVVICVAETSGITRALVIKTNQDVSDAIDQKILELQKLPQIKQVSIYGRFIHVSPELGELSYQPSIGGFGYDPDRIKSVSAAIMSEVSRLGIDTTRYTVVNPFR